ncbi:MAG: GNAT family N-acetyltransferase [Myxococcota bacterium]
MFVLSTPRLTLRRFVGSDAPALAALLMDPVVMWDRKKGPFTEDEVLGFIGRMEVSYDTRGYGFFAVEHAEDHRFLGFTGILDQHIDGRTEPEIGYRLLAREWGSGFATEAAQASLRLGREKFGLDRLISIIRPDNTRSQRVAQKNGFTREKTVFWDRADMDVDVWVSPPRV